MLAVLPMYDWPEVRAETDAAWVNIRDALRSEGIDAPDALDRSVGYEESWRRPDLVLGQACGLPFARGLTGEAVPIGPMDFGLADCAPGEYYSVIVTRADCDLGLDDLTGRTFAFNDPGSQSGLACVQKLGLTNGEGVETGSHRASIKAVANKDAEFAAIDAKTWTIALAHEPAAKSLQILGRTPITPSPIYVAAKGADVAAYRRALNLPKFDFARYRSLL